MFSVSKTQPPFTIIYIYYTSNKKDFIEIKEMAVVNKVHKYTSMDSNTAMWYIMVWASRVMVSIKI